MGARANPDSWPINWSMVLLVKYQYYWMRPSLYHCFLGFLQFIAQKLLNCLRKSKKPLKLEKSGHVVARNLYVNMRDSGGMAQVVY